MGEQHATLSDAVIARVIFQVDNSQAKQPTQGIGFRRSPRLHDLAPKQSHLKWNSVARGKLLKNGWIRMPEGYLPMIVEIQGRPVQVIQLLKVKSVSLENVGSTPSSRPQSQHVCGSSATPVSACSSSLAGVCGHSCAAQHQPCESVARRLSPAPEAVARTSRSSVGSGVSTHARMPIPQQDAIRGADSALPATSGVAPQCEEALHGGDGPAPDLDDTPLACSAIPSGDLDDTPLACSTIPSGDEDDKPLACAAILSGDEDDKPLAGIVLPRGDQDDLPLTRAPSRRTLKTRWGRKVRSRMSFGKRCSRVLCASPAGSRSDFSQGSSGIRQLCRDDQPGPDLAKELFPDLVVGTDVWLWHLLAAVLAAMQGSAPASVVVRAATACWPPFNSSIEVCGLANVVAECKWLRVDSGAGTVTLDQGQFTGGLPEIPLSQMLACEQTWPSVAAFCDACGDPTYPIAIRCAACPMYFSCPTCWRRGTSCGSHQPQARTPAGLHHAPIPIRTDAHEDGWSLWEDALLAANLRKHGAGNWDRHARAMNAECEQRREPAEIERRFLKIGAYEGGKTVTVHTPPRKEEDGQPFPVEYLFVAHLDDAAPKELRDNAQKAVLQVAQLRKLSNQRRTRVADVGSEQEQTLTALDGLSRFMSPEEMHEVSSLLSEERGIIRRLAEMSQSQGPRSHRPHWRSQRWRVSHAIETRDEVEKESAELLSSEERGIARELDVPPWLLLAAKEKAVGALGSSGAQGTPPTRFQVQRVGSLLSVSARACSTSGSTSN